MKKSPKKLLFVATLLFFVIISSVTLIYNSYLTAQDTSYEIRNQIVTLNEIEQLSKTNDKDSVQEKTEQLKKQLHTQLENGNTQAVSALWIIYGISIGFLLSVFLYAYFKIVRPFEMLNDYALEIAKGNFDVKLNYERQNYFGAFTWAFDHMRREIIKARSCEKEAIDNNKTVIATLSHDIKTPVSSIRAYSEALQANMDTNAEKRERYLSVIMKKCDEVSALTNDLFIHSLSDLDKLKMISQKLNIKPLIEKTVSELSADDSKIKIYGTIYNAELLIDEKRFVQVLENIINNSKKYAPNTVIKLWTEKDENSYEIHIKDGGNGIPDEDMPFIFEKFYRGKNVGSNQGSGLGLYIVKYIMNRMNGEVYLENYSDGLETVLKFF